MSRSIGSWKRTGETFRFGHQVEASTLLLGQVQGIQLEKPSAWSPQGNSHWSRRRFTTDTPVRDGVLEHVSFRNCEGHSVQNPVPGRMTDQAEYRGGFTKLDAAHARMRRVWLG